MLSSYPPQRWPLASVLAGAAYICFSVTLNLSNKAIAYSAISSYQLVLFQSLFTVVLVSLTGGIGLVSYKPVKYKNIKRWIFPGIAYVAMLVTGQASIRRLPVPMVTLLKNIALVFIAVGDRFIFAHQISRESVLLLVLMFSASVVGAISDLALDLSAYLWMGANVVSASYYVLAVRYEMKKSKLSDFTLVYYNNFVTVSLLAPTLLFSGLPTETPLFYVPLSLKYISLWLINGICGFLITLSSFWVIRHTSATTYSMLGALSKVPLSILGWFIFPKPMTFFTISMVSLGLLAAVAYSWQKHAKISTPSPMRNMKNRSDADLTALEADAFKGGERSKSFAVV